MIVLVCQILGVGIKAFVLPNPGWVVDRPNTFQPPGNNLKYPLVYNLFSTQKTPGYPRPRSTLEIIRPSSMPH